jgi:hypothetical protein
MIEDRTAWTRSRTPETGILFLVAQRQVKLLLSVCGRVEIEIESAAAPSGGRYKCQLNFQMGNSGRFSGGMGVHFQGPQKICH